MFYKDRSLTLERSQGKLHYLNRSVTSSNEKSKSWFPTHATSTKQAFKGSIIYLPLYVIDNVEGENASPLKTFKALYFYL